MWAMLLLQNEITFIYTLKQDGIGYSDAEAQLSSVAKRLKIIIQFAMLARLWCGNANGIVNVVNSKPRLLPPAFSRSKFQQRRPQQCVQAQHLRVCTLRRSHVNAAGTAAAAEPPLAVNMLLHRHELHAVYNETVQQHASQVGVKGSVRLPDDLGQQQQLR
jgi:hypothetical protein